MLMDSFQIFQMGMKLWLEREVILYQVDRNKGIASPHVQIHTYNLKYHFTVCKVEMHEAKKSFQLERIKHYFRFRESL